MRRASLWLIMVGIAVAISATAVMAAGKGKGKGQAPAGAPAKPKQPGKPAGPSKPMPAIDVLQFGSPDDPDFDAMGKGLAVVRPRLIACAARELDEAAIRRMLVAVALLSVDAKGSVTGGRVSAGGRPALETCLLEALKALPAPAGGRGWVAIAFVFQKQVDLDGDDIAGGIFESELRGKRVTDIEHDVVTSPPGQARTLSTRLFEQLDAIDDCYQKHVPKKARQPVSFLVDVELAPDGKVSAASVDGTGVQALDACVGLLVKKTVTTEPPPVARVSVLVHVRPVKPGAPRKVASVDRVRILSDGSMVGWPDRTSALRVAAHRQVDALLACYRDGLTRDPGLAGHLMLFLAHDAAGELTVPAAGGLGDADVEACVARVFSSLKLEDPLPAGAAIVTITFSPGVKGQKP